MTSASTNAQRFLAAFREIEITLRRKLDRGGEAPFGQLLREAANRDPAVERRRNDLREYAELRNAIVHQSRGNEAIAEPHESAVADLERISRLIADPPQLGSHFSKPVKRASSDERVGVAAALMYEGRFSQLPVYSEHEFEALLTAETIMRWVAAHLTDEIGMLEELPVSDVLAYAEDAENHRFLPRRASVFDALRAFDAFSRRGKSLDAIIITDAGRPSQAPLGIVTVFDIPRLLELGGG